MSWAISRGNRGGIEMTEPYRDYALWSSENEIQWLQRLRGYAESDLAEIEKRIESEEQELATLRADSQISQSVILRQQQDISLLQEGAKALRADCNFYNENIQNFIKSGPEKEIRIRSSSESSEWSDLSEEAQKAERCSNQAVVIIVGGLVLVAAVAMLFIPDSPIGVVGGGESKKGSRGEGAEAESAFTVSGVCFRGVDELMGDINSFDGWLGDSGTGYKASNTGFGDSVAQAAATSRQVDAVVRTQAEQVEDGRATLGNVFDGLQLAMPVSESLYFSGPAGPALSYSFQLAVANVGVGTSVDTTNAMHESSRKHGEHLAVLAQRYDEAFTRVGICQPV